MALPESRQAISLGLLGEGSRGGDTKPEYRPGWRGLASSNRNKPVGRAYADVHLMAVIHQKEVQPLCWEGEGAATLIQPGMTAFSPYISSVFHQRKGWLTCLYTPEVISTPKESPQQPTILLGRHRARLIYQREEALISSWYHSGRDYMSQCVDGKSFGGVSCNSHILIFMFVLFCSSSLSSHLNLKKQKICECTHLHECEVVWYIKSNVVFQLEHQLNWKKM